MKTTKLSFHLLPILGLLLLSACRIDMDYEIWLSADQSGRAEISTSVTLPDGEDDLGIEEGMEKDNALEELAARIRDTEGAELTKLDKETIRDNEEVTFRYLLAFKFNNVQTLQKVLCQDPDKGISLSKTGKYKILTVDPRQFTLQSMDEANEYIGMFNMNMSLKLNLPKKAVEVTPTYTGFKKQKSLSWSFVLDDDWYAQDERLISVKYK